MSIRNRIAVSFATLFAVTMLAGCETGPEVKSEAPAPQTVATAPKQEVKKPAGPVMPKGVTVISTEALKALVDKGSEAGNYLLFDSRPAGRFNAATIPTSQHLTDAEMEKLNKEGKVASRLGDDKNKLAIFWCGGPT
ncbi:MAG: rhodanese-like domain-containing protein [Trichlorobacter sp.]|uniref:rhodanese-like domain-containing protein n=1 Tax=Trichlorobacter sp. TaxID=2911007 RepID=UPI00256D763D|nr:rhodanese-like domain-containing protein [Trichlorobacter sp.]MDK9717491.1 rhodanese-like domain-containing protein [Trichlorobacter sp.]